MFRIQIPPKEPKKKESIYFHLDNFYFENKPVSKWLGIVEKHIETMISFDPGWDVQGLSLENIYAEMQDEYDYQSLQMKVVIWETSGSFEARHKKWEKDFREWEEWTYHHNDEIEAEEERRETEKLDDQRKIVARAKQLALQEERKLIQMKGK